jgi:hypothetical protein
MSKTTWGYIGAIVLIVVAFYAGKTNFWKKPTV